MKNIWVLNKLFNFLFLQFILMNDGAEGGGASALAAGGEGDAGGTGTTVGQPGHDSGAAPEPKPWEPGQGLYDFDVNWPEGMEEGLRAEASLQPFFQKGQDGKGNLDVNNLLKSYVHTKKLVGKDKVVVPDDMSDDHTKNEFWSKLGWKPNEAEYKFENPEDSKVDQEFFEKFVKFSHENRVPQGVAKSMVEFMNKQIAEVTAKEQEQVQSQYNEWVNEVKNDWGAAYEGSVSRAQRVLKEVVGDPAILNDPAVGNNPAVLRTLLKIGDYLYSEDGFKGGALASDGLTPDNAAEEINKIYGDPNHPYHHPGHPSHEDASKKMQKLFEYKNMRRS